ncbi:MAG TPA: hypothetical protein VFQ61_14785 [Polyangiaceae bacterium]|nr:hypothetical protein [Polyangiaceae bacterium]
MATVPGSAADFALPSGFGGMVFDSRDWAPIGLLSCNAVSCTQEQCSNEVC